MCWHVYGLMYRADRDYREATKCYRNALRIDGTNLQILRDLSLLQIQLRDYAGFLETRSQLLQLQPKTKINWVSFAVANHLSGLHETALAVMEEFEKIYDEVNESERYEHSEMLLYKAMIMMESGKYADGVKYIGRHWASIRDKAGAEEMMASMLLKMGRNKEAAMLYRKRIMANPENYDYHTALCSALGADAGGSLHELYSELQETFPKGSAVRRIPLDFLTGDSFERAFLLYIQPFISRGVPSLFSDIRPLYADPQKKAIIARSIEATYESLRDTGRFPGSANDEPPTSMVWVLLLRARHFDELEDYDTALGVIDEAISHTPTVIDLYTTKSSILKHAGDVVAAAAVADEARKMDLNDRYLNSFCVKRMLANDDIENAEKVVALFSRLDDQASNLYDMQCMWYEIAAGQSFDRVGEMGKSLKKFLAVGKHFDDITEDQFDFHQYCIRKMTIRTYIRMLRVEDELYGHKYYLRGAKGAILGYLKLADKPSASVASSSADDIDMSKLTPAEKKKLRNRLRKERKQREEAEEAAAEAEKRAAKEAAKDVGKGRGRGGMQRDVDPDPHGKELLKCDNPLGEAAKIVSVLERHSGRNFDTHVLAFEVHMRRRKFLLALRAMLRAFKMDPRHPETHRAIATFFHTIDSLPGHGDEGALSDVVAGVIRVQREKLLGAQSLVDFNAAWLKSTRESESEISALAAAAAVHMLLHPTEQEKAISLVLGSSWKTGKMGMDPVRSRKGLDESIRVHQLLKTTLASAEAADVWARKCSATYTHSSYFEGEKHLERLSALRSAAAAAVAAATVSNNGAA